MTGMSDRPAKVTDAVSAAAAAALVLAGTDALVRFGAFRIVAGRIQGAVRRLRPIAEDEALAVRRVRWAMAAAQRRLPWTVPCLATAIAANRLLAWRGIPSEVWLGVRASRE